MYYHVSCEDLVWDIIVHATPETVFALNDFGSCGSDDAVRKALSRATLSNKLLRIVEGVYALPSNPSPPPAMVANALAKNHYWTIRPSTELARKDLDLCYSTLLYETYYSTGPTTTYTYGPPSNRQKLKMLRITRKFVHVLSYQASVVVIALMDLDAHNITAEEVYSLSQKLSPNTKNDLLKHLSFIPARLRPIIEVICDNFGRSERPDYQSTKREIVPPFKA